MAFASIIRFQSAVQEFFQHRKEQHDWSEDDIVYLVKSLLEGYPPLLVEAAIEAEIHHRVTWKQCPLCQISLSDEDIRHRHGFCLKCDATEDKMLIPLFAAKRVMSAGKKKYKPQHHGPIHHNPD